MYIYVRMCVWKEFILLLIDKIQFKYNYKNALYTQFN